MTHKTQIMNNCTKNSAQMKNFIFIKIKLTKFSSPRQNPKNHDNVQKFVHTVFAGWTYVITNIISYSRWPLVSTQFFKIYYCCPFLSPSACWPSKIRIWLVIAQEILVDVYQYFNLGAWKSHVIYQSRITKPSCRDLQQSKQAYY